MIEFTLYMYIPYMNTTTHGCVREVLLLKILNFRAGGEWLCALGGQQTQNVPNRRTDDLLADPIGIFDLKIISNGNSLIFFFAAANHVR